MRRLSLSIPSLMGCLILAPASALAQGIIIDIRPGSADLPLAMPKPVVSGGQGQSEADALWDAAWTDLGMSGYFELQDPAGYVDTSTSVAPGTVDFESWKLIGTSVLIKTAAYPVGHANCGASMLCADVYAYYVVTGDALMKRRFKVAGGSPRHLGHAIANAVLEATTGTAGAFGTRLAAVGSKSGNKEVYVMDTDGKSLSPVTRNGAINLSPAWSPDAGSIAWTSYKKANPDLYVKDLGTGRTRVISNTRGVNTSPAFSPDGRQIAMAQSVEGDSDIFLVDASTGARIRQVTTGGGIDVSPVFTPDGQHLIFASERSGGSQVYRTDLSGNDAERLTFAGDFNIDPVVSPDGTKLAFVGRSKGGFDIYVADLNGRNVVRLTQDMRDNEDPTWSPDSRYVVFSSTRAGLSDLWISTSDGRHQTQITRGGGWTQPSWAPIR